MLPSNLIHDQNTAFLIGQTAEPATRQEIIDNLYRNPDVFADRPAHHTQRVGCYIWAGAGIMLVGALSILNLWKDFLRADAAPPFEEIPLYVMVTVAGSWLITTIGFGSLFYGYHQHRLKSYAAFLFRELAAQRNFRQGTIHRVLSANQLDYAFELDDGQTIYGQHVTDAPTRFVTGQPVIVLYLNATVHVLL